VGHLPLRSSVFAVDSRGLGKEIDSLADDLAGTAFSSVGSQTYVVTVAGGRREVGELPHRQDLALDVKLRRVGHLAILANPTRAGRW
jgi:hypothetical protein